MFSFGSFIDIGALIAAISALWNIFSGLFGFTAATG